MPYDLCTYARTCAHSHTYVINAKSKAEAAILGTLRMEQALYCAHASRLPHNANPHPAAFSTVLQRLFHLLYSSLKEIPIQTCPSPYRHMHPTSPQSLFHRFSRVETVTFSSPSIHCRVGPRQSKAAQGLKTKKTAFLCGSFPSSQVNYLPPLERPPRAPKVR